MLEYDKTDISEGIDMNKTSTSEECDICYYFYFLHKNVKYDQYLCNDYHDLIQKAMDYNDVATVSVKGSDYRSHFWHICKVDTHNEQF